MTTRMARVSPRRDATCRSVRALTGVEVPVTASRWWARSLIQMGGHLATLTALRFAAALLVFGAHAWRIFDVQGSALQVGAVGVSFFFVLSGFVLTWSRRPGETAGRFYWHRFARVWPATAIVTLLATGYGFPHQSLLLDLGLVNTWRPGQLSEVSANPPSWSLGDEAFFTCCSRLCSS